MAGVLGLLCPVLIPSIVAVCAGHSACKLTRSGAIGGYGQATAGMILGYLVLVPAAAALTFFVGGQVLGLFVN